jgi:AcrR family transcriptional regulator
MTAGERRERVLEAALTEFAAGGLDGTSTQDIARRAGISQAYLFRLFPTKKALFLAVIRRCFQLVADVFAAAAEGKAGEDALAAMGNAFCGLRKERTLLLVQIHACAARTDPEMQAATRAGFWELWLMAARLTGLPPGRVRGWFGIGVLMTATTAMDLQAIDKRWATWCPG